MIILFLILKAIFGSRNKTVVKGHYMNTRRGRIWVPAHKRRIRKRT